MEQGRESRAQECHWAPLNQLSPCATKSLNDFPRSETIRIYRQVQFPRLVRLHLDFVIGREVVADEFHFAVRVWRHAMG